jgi:hypothetical protein
MHGVMNDIQSKSHVLKHFSHKIVTDDWGSGKTTYTFASVAKAIDKAKECVYWHCDREQTRKWLQTSAVCSYSQEQYTVQAWALEGSPTVGVVLRMDNVIFAIGAHAEVMHIWIV